MSKSTRITKTSRSLVSDENQFCLWGVVLAGGAGSRMGSTGRLVPKVYLHIGLEPVINRPVSGILKPDVGADRTIVLTRRSHTDLPNVDLEKWAENWKDQNFPDKKGCKSIEIWYEENATDYCRGAEYGAVVALERLILLIDRIPMSKHNYPTHILLALGDNFIESDLNSLVNIAKKNTTSTILAARYLDNRIEAQGRFGVMQLDEHDGDNQIGYPVLRYDEKPDDPSSNDISVGLYLFPMATLKKVSNYLDSLKLGNPSSLKSKKKYYGAPGYFIEYLARDTESRKTLRACRMDRKARWVDVGTESSLLSSMVQLTDELLLRPTCARDLVVLGSTEKLSDKCYFTCDDICIDVHQRVLALHIYGENKIATSAYKSWNDNVLTVNQIKDAPEDSEFWKRFKSRAVKPRNFRLINPILISAGVFLFDSAGGEGYQQGRVMVPLFLRDIGASFDAMRLTTAAGRMDKLNLYDVCVSELAEEMLFVVCDNQTTQILFFAPQSYAQVARRTAVTRILEKNIDIPGVDRQTIVMANRDIGHGNAPSLFCEPQTWTLKPKQESWIVDVKYWERHPSSNRVPEPDIHFRAENMLLIPDKKARTIEVRLSLLANITLPALSANPPIFDPNYRSLGRLRAIVDADGYGRTAVMVSATDLAKYLEILKNPGNLFYTSDPHYDESLVVQAITDGRTGRLRNIERKVWTDEGKRQDRWGHMISVAPMTTSVSELAQILSQNSPFKI